MMRFRAYHRVCAFLPALWLILPLSVPAASVGSQQQQSDPAPAEESQSERPFTFEVPVNVVLVNVSVTDNAGQPVRDLTADDFRVYEDGKRQKIQSLELEPSQPVVAAESAAPAGGQPGVRTPGVQAAKVAESEPTRLISCFIDDLTERSPRYFGWLASTLQEFVAEEMGPRDQVGIFSASGGVRIPFTSDQRLLQDRIADLLPGKLDLSRPYRADGRDPDYIAQRVTLTDLQAIRIVEGSLVGDVDLTTRSKAQRQYQETQAAIQRLAASLGRHLRYLQHFRARKSLVLLSEGFVPGKSTRWRLDRTIDKALRSRVPLNIVDFRGLNTVGFDDGSDLPPVTPGFTPGRNVGRDLSALFLNQVHQERSLEKLAENTGGIFFRNNNDLLAGLRQIRNAQSFYYVISYASPDQTASGEYHNIRVEVDRPGLELRYRRGYFAPREQLSLEDLKNEDFQLALEAPGDFDQIPLRLAYESSRLGSNRYRLSVLTSVNIGGIRFWDDGKRRRNLVHLVVALYDQNEKHVKGSEKRVELNLSDASYHSMLRRGFTAKTDMEVPAGRYTVKAVVRESNQSKMGSLRQTVTLPLAGGGAKATTVARKTPSPSFPVAGLESSTLVLTQSLTRLADMSAEQQQSVLEIGDALIFKDIQIHSPDGDRIDRRHPVTFFYTLYNLKYPEESEGMTAKIQLTDEDGRVSRFPLVLLGESKTQPRGERRMTVAFNLSFKEIQPGKYKLTVMTRAPAAGGQSVGSRATVTVLE